MCKKCSECSDCVKECGKRSCVGAIVCVALFSLILGCLIGVHKNVIKAYIKKEELPEAPEWHFWCKK